MPKVSVIIPIYNVEKYLRKCIDSILAQTLDDLEVILVDDGSTDGSPEICNEYGELPNVTVIHQTNKGLSAARNSGMRAAKGEYVAFVDSDDYVAEEMYAEMYSCAKHNTVDIVCCNYALVQDERVLPNQDGYLPDNRIIEPFEIRNILTSERGSKLLWFAWKSLFSREMLIKNEILFIEEPIVEDTPFNLDVMLSANAVWFINKPFYYYVQTPTSIIRGGYKKNFYLKLNNCYIARKSISEKHKLMGYQDALYAYSMTHTLVMLVSNEMGNSAPMAERVKTLREIRNTELVEETFAHADVNLIHSRICWAVLLLKYRVYWLLALLLS